MKTAEIIELHTVGALYIDSIQQYFQIEVKEPEI